jgi:catecholate siderophore receptor
VVETQRFGVAPSVAFGIGTPTRVTLAYFHLQQENVSDYGIPWVTATNNALAAFRNRPAPVPRETFYGFRSRDLEDLSSDLGTVRLDRELRTSLSLRSQLRYGHSTRESNATPPRFASDDSTVVNRELRAWSTVDEIWDLQNDLTARFHTGGVGHALVAGFSYTNENNVRRTRTGPSSPTTLLDPNPDDVYTGAIVPGAFVGDVTGRSTALYAFDTLSLGSRLELSGGLRFDRFDASGVTTANAPVERVDEMLSGRAGIVFKPVPLASLYAAYGTSLNPSLEGLSYGTANTAIDPERTRTFELGGKWDLFGERLLLSAAGFRVQKLDARTPGLLPGDPPQVLQGRQEVQGLELGVSGTLAHGWQVFAAYTLLDSEIVESNTPAELGRELVNTPRHSLSVWASGRLPGRVGLGLGGRHVSARFGNTINTRHVDGYWLLDGMLSYPVVRRLELRLNLYNLTDTYYFSALGGGHLIPGNARSAVLNAKLKF